MQFCHLYYVLCCVLCAYFCTCMFFFFMGSTYTVYIFCIPLSFFYAVLCFSRSVTFYSCNMDTSAALEHRVYISGKPLVPMLQLLWNTLKSCSGTLYQALSKHELHIFCAQNISRPYGHKLPVIQQCNSHVACHGLVH